MRWQVILPLACALVAATGSPARAQPDRTRPNIEVRELTELPDEQRKSGRSRPE